MHKLSGRVLAVAATISLTATMVAVSPAAAAEPTAGWSTTIGSTGDVRYFDAAAADNGAVVLAGWDQRDTGGVLPETDGVVRKLDSAGNEVWKTLIGDDGAADYILAVDVADDGSVFVTGWTRGDIAGRTGGTDYDVFVAKLSSAGAVQWTAQFGANGTNNDDKGVAIAAASDGSVFVGAFVSFSSFPAVTRYDANGTELWQYAYGNAGDIIDDMTMGGDGSAYFSGHSATDGFVMSASLAGTASSTTRIPGVSTMRVASAPDGDVVAGGDRWLGRFGSFGFLEWSDSAVPMSIVDVSVEPDGSILAFANDTGGANPALRGFAATGGVESWSKSLSAQNGGRVVSTTDGGAVTSAMDGSYDVAHLARFTGSSTGEPTTVAGFTDVSSDAYYADAVAWLKAEGITTGTSATTYSPNDVVTRDQMAAFLHRLAGSPGGNPAHGFSDVGDGTYYAEAVRWLKDQGITTGTSSTTYSPGDAVTRGQMAAFLYRMATDSDWDYPGD